MINEQQVITKAQSGDRDSLNALVSCYWQPIYRLVLYKMGNPEDAQELTQETFLKAFRSLSRYEFKEVPFKTYLGRIALNLVTDYWRKKGRTPPVIDIAEYQMPLVDTGLRPEEAALDHERQEEMSRLVRLLPDDQRRAVELRIIAGLSVKEAADMMGKTEAALKMLQQRALKSLRRMVQAQEVVQ